MSNLLLPMLVGLSIAGEPIAISSSPSLDMVMPGARPNLDDSYLCSSFDVTKLSQATDTMSALHVTGFVPKADAHKAHHMLLYSCDDPNEKPGVVYNCLHHRICRGGQIIMFAWAKNAPPTTLPPGVSFNINPVQRKFLVLQIHYAHPLQEEDYTGLSLTYQVDPTKYTAGILLMVRSGLSIPPNTPVVHGDVNCKLPSDIPLHMFAYRTHAHSLSPVITGYVYNQKGHTYREIARGSPQWPQAFYPMKKVQTVSPGEIVTARCTYNSTGVNHATNIGSTAGDEMCNLYIMYYTKPGEVADYIKCANEQEGAAISRGLPADSDKAPEAKPELEAHAMDSSVDAGPGEINYAQMFEEELQQSTSKKKGGLEHQDTAILSANYNLTMPGNDQPLPLDSSLENKAAAGQEAGLMSYINGLPDAVKKESSVMKRPGVENGNVKKEPGLQSNYGTPVNTTNLIPSFHPSPVPSNGQPAHEEEIEQLSPDNKNSFVELVAAISVLLTLLVVLWWAYRRCRKTGNGTVVGTTYKNEYKRLSTVQDV